MEVKKELINKAVKECENTGAIIRYSGPVLKIHDTTKGTAKRILIVTNLFITYFKISANPVEDRKNYWHNVTSFNYEDNRIELYFDNAPFRFISDNSSEIFDIIMEIFLRCFTPDEIAPLDLARFAHPPIKVNGLGILNRNSIILAATDTEQTKGELEKLRDFVEYSKPSFEIQGTSNYFKAIIEIVRAAPYLNSLIFPKVQETKNLYKIIAKFIQKPSKVNMISLYNRPDDNFDQLSKKSSTPSNTNNKSNITALKFIDVEMEEEDLERIQNFAASTNIESLSFCNSLPTGILNSFSTNFLESEIISNLSYLCLDGTKELNINEIIGKLSKLSILSLSDCNLEISNVFNQLAKSKIQNLRYLNLSHNKCSFNSKKLRLPPYLERIDLNSIEWTNSSLPKFLTQLFKQELKDGIKLYINKIKIDDNEWESVFDTFESLTNYPLVEFSWNHNKLSSKFFDFLSNNSQLSYLFLNGCFSHTNEEEIIQFSRILPNLVNCTHLVIKGASDPFALREKVTILFEHIKKMNSITYIDFSNNIISSEGVEGFSKLINECSRLSHISFDGSKFDDNSCFENLIKEGEKRKRPLFINWPKNDIKDLENSLQINESSIQAYKEKLNLLSTGISNSKTKAIRKSMQGMTNISNFSKSSRMSMRMLKSENSNAEKKKKNERSRSLVRDIRTSSFRGVQRPNLLVPEKSHMEFDPNSPLNKTFEVYCSYFTHKFPEYYTQSLKNIFACNPIQYQELDDISSSGEEEEGKEEIDDNDNDNDNKSNDAKSETSSKSLKSSPVKEKSIDVNKNDENEEEEEVIELSLLNDIEITPIKQLEIPERFLKKSIDYDENKPHSKMLNDILNLPKLKPINKAPPLFQIENLLSNFDEYYDDNQIDRSSLNINNETKELKAINSTINIDNISDFSSDVSENDIDENLDDIKTFMNKIKDSADN